MRVADELKAMRKALNKSPEEMAVMVGVGRQTYRNWENDVGEPRVSHFRKICSACKARPGNMFFSSSTTDFFLEMLVFLPKHRQQEIKTKLTGNKK